MATTAQAIGLTASGLASGLALAYPLMVNPVFLSKNESFNAASDAQRLSIWQLGYTRGLRTIPSLAVTAAIGLFLSKHWAEGAATSYSYIAAGLHVSIIPFTVIFMLGNVNRLQQLAKNKGEGAYPGEVNNRLTSWCAAHWARIALTVAGFGIAVADVVSI